MVGPWAEGFLVRASSCAPSVVAARASLRFILLYRGLKDKARIHTVDLIKKKKKTHKKQALQKSTLIVAFQIPSASKDAYKKSFFPQTIRDCNDLPDSLVYFAELSDECVTSLVGAMFVGRKKTPRYVK